MSDENWRRRSTPASGTSWRLLNQEQKIENLVEALEKSDDRIRQLELELRSIATEANGLRYLIDKLHAEAARNQHRISDHDRQIDKLEARDENNRARGTVVASGAGLAGGGVLYGMLELLRRMLE